MKSWTLVFMIMAHCGLDIWILDDSIPYWAGASANERGRPNLRLREGLGVTWWSGLFGLERLTALHSASHGSTTRANGDCIKCFQCDNSGNPACGENFKSYQFPADNCPGRSFKCGLQRQQQKGEYIGILRACYELGTMGLEDESDGCQDIWVAGKNETLSFCLCSQDYCNHFSSVTASYVVTCFSACLSLLVILNRA